VSGERMKTIILKDLPKVSLNQFYAGIHWTKRKAYKDAYKLLIASQTKEIFTAPCRVMYRFTFKNNALDCSNCIGMVKMIEDCLFPNDSYKIVKSMMITSERGKRDSVEITVST